MFDLNIEKKSYLSIETLIISMSNLWSNHNNLII